jgi:hypothetical protein
MLIYTFMCLYIVTYSGGGVNVLIVWTDVEEQFLSGVLPSEIFQTLNHDFYSTFKFKIMTAHYHFVKQTYGFSDDHIFKSVEMKRAFIPK